VNIFKRSLLLTAGLLTTVIAHAQVPELINNPDFRPDAKAAVDSIYNFNFDGADKVLSPWKEEYPDHPLWGLVDGMKFWWQILSDLENTEHDDAFIEMMKKANYQAGKLLHRQSSHADALLIQAIANGYIGRQYSNREEWISSLNYARKAMKAYEKLGQLYPDMADLKLAEGLKLYYAAYLPEEYPVVKTVSWFLPDGNKEKGLEKLREAAESGIFARAEATYFLGNINFNYEHNYSAAVDRFEELTERYPQNNYYVRLLVKTYYNMRRYNEALDFIGDALERWRTHTLPYQTILEGELLVWKGRILERKKQPQKALDSYRKSYRRIQELSNPGERSFGVIAAYGSGHMLYEQEKFSEAKKYLHKAEEADAAPQYREKAANLLSKM